MLNKAIHFTKLSRTDYMSSVGVLFQTSTNDEAIRSAVVDFGYNDERLDEGKTLYNQLDALEREHDRVGGEKMKLVERKQLLQKSVAKAYMKYLKIARIAFAGHSQAMDVLLLEGTRERTYNKWFGQVMVFCNNLLEHKEYWPMMESYGVKALHVEKLKNDLNILSDLADQCNKATAAIKQLTQKKLKQTLKVQNWVSDYIKIARIALEDQPQHLVKLGIMVRGEGKQSAAGRPKSERRNVNKINPATA